MKKYIPFGLALILILFVTAPFILLKYNYTWQYEANYTSYADNFNAVAKYIQSQYPDETDKYLVISYSADYGRRLYDPDTSTDIQLPSNVQSSLNTICYDAFPNPNGHPDVIRVHGNRISFCIPNGQYALVFSPDGKPTWVNSPEENCNVKVKSIGGDWYHVTVG